MNRRDFLKGILAAGVAPAIVRAEWIMPVRSVVIPALPNWSQGIVATEIHLAAQRDVSAMARAFYYGVYWFQVQHEMGSTEITPIAISKIMDTGVDRVGYLIP